MRETGGLRAVHVHLAARAAGVSDRTMWRWLAAGAPACRGRRSPELSDLEREWVLAARGNVAAAHRGLAEAGAATDSLAAFRRRLARDMTNGQRAYARSGTEGRRAHDVYLRWEPGHRGQIYEADHKQLAIAVLPPRAQRPQRPWATLIIDAFSRLIVGWAVSLQPTQAEVLGALREAVVADPARTFGGVPDVLRVDGGLEFAARSIEDACAALGVLVDRTQPYSPWQKGKIERLNRTIDDSLLSALPGWADGPRAANGRLLGAKPELSLVHFVGLFAAWVDDYNERRPHSALDGLTPLERWREDSYPVPRIPVEEARWLLLAGERRKVLKDGIHFRGDVFIAPELTGLVGEEVEVRFMPHDQRSIELHHAGQWLATAYPQAALTHEQRDAILQRRREEAGVIARQARKARRLTRQRLAPITQAGIIEDATLPAVRDELAARRPRKRTAALELLDLGDRVDTPTSDPHSDGRAARA
jgi:putative transposase